MPGIPASDPETVVARRLAGVVLAIWFLVTALLALVEINDPDLGFHIAWGRLLQSDFASARNETWGQAPAVTRYAYSYWLYQVTVSWMYDHWGPASLVIGRALTVLGTAGLGVALARRLGATWSACALGLVLFTLVSHERFVDRPDLFSHLLWTSALWILLRHSSGRGLWLLIPLQVIWANSHVYFGLLPALALLMLGAAWFEARARTIADGRAPNLRRVVLVVLLLVVAACLTPAGPAAWRSQFTIARFLTGAAPIEIPIQEMVSPFAASEPSLALWTFRIAMPVIVIGALLARRRIGLPALAALLFAALLGASARRAISLFGCTALVVAPLLFDAALARMRSAGGARGTAGDALGPTRWGRNAISPVLLAVALIVGIAGVAGLLNGRIFLAQDKNFRVGSFGPPNYNVRPASRFLRDQHVEGPIFTAPVHAGPLLLENGDRLTPFLDARWLGTPETMDLFTKLREANDRTIPSVWKEACDARQFQSVLLDFYEMPALLRRLWVDADWAPVFIDDGGAVFVNRRGPNRQLARTNERGVRAAVLNAPADVQEQLAEATSRFLASSPPPFWKPLEFPYESFYRANFALQIRERKAAQAAYLELLRSENGSLWASTHRLDVLGNLLWCLPPEETAAGLELIGALRTEPSIPEESRRSLRMQELRARAMRGNDPLAESLAEEVSGDPATSPEERQWAWAQVATGREQAEDWVGLLAALRRADEELPDTPAIWRSLGLVLDLRLERTEEAASAYRKFLELGGTDSLVTQRLRLIES